MLLYTDTIYLHNKRTFLHIVSSFKAFGKKIPFLMVLTRKNQLIFTGKYLILCMFIT